MGLPYRTLNISHEKELLRGLWVEALSSYPKRLRPKSRNLLSQNDAATQTGWELKGRLGARTNYRTRASDALQPCILGGYIADTVP